MIISGDDEDCVRGSDIGIQEVPGRSLIRRGLVEKVR
jgi:hypothetical protein